MKALIPLAISLLLALMLILWFSWEEVTRSPVSADIPSAAAASPDASPAAAGDPAVQSAPSDAMRIADAPVETQPAPSATSATSWPRSIVLGRVVDEHGAPIAGANVRMHAAGERWAEGQEVPVVEHGRWKIEEFSTQTGEEGRFRFDVPRPTSSWISLVIEAGSHRGRAGRDFGFAGGRKQPPIVAGENELGDFALSPTGAVKGEVRAAGGGPIAGARVRLDGVFPGGYGVETETDSAGLFELGRVPEGSQTIGALAQGYLSATSRGVEVRVNQTTQGLQFQLERAPTISGRVVDESGTPLAKIRIDGWPRGSGQGAGARSRDDGSFTMFLPQDEPYTLEVEDPGFEPWGERSRRAAFPPGTTDALVRLTRIGRTQFVVVDGESGSPIERFGLEVVAKDDGGGSWQARSGTSVSDHPRGELEMAAEPGKNTVLVEAPGHAPLEAPVAHDAAGARRQTLRLVRGGSIHGRVVRDGASVERGAAHASIRVERAALPKTEPSAPAPDGYQDDYFANLPSYDLSMFLGRERTVEADASGAFRIDDLAPGTWQVVAGAPGAAPRTLSGLKIEGDGALDAGTIALEKGCLLRARVAVGTGSTPIGLEVTLDDWNQRRIIQTAEGRVEFADLAPGKHTLIVERSPPVCLANESVEVELAPGETKEIVVDLAAKAPCKASVRVFRDGKPLAGCKVTVSEIVEDWARNNEELGVTDATGAVAGVVPSGASIRFEARAPNGCAIGATESTIPPAGGLHEARIDVQAGRLVLELPATIEVPAQGTLDVRLQRGSPESREFEWLPLATELAPFSMGRGVWKSRRVELGEVAAGDYQVFVNASKLEGDVQQQLGTPLEGKVTIVHGQITVLDLR